MLYMYMTVPFLVSTSYDEDAQFDENVELATAPSVHALGHGIGYTVHDCTVNQQCMLWAMVWGTQYMIVQ